MAVRFDIGTISKSEITDEGFLRCHAAFARDGILEYRTPDGQVRYELRTPEANKKAITSFGLKPVTLEHPPVLLDSRNTKQYAIGMTDSTVVYDKGGFVRGVITVFDSDAVESIRSGATVEISAGYQCNIDSTPGTWNGQRYDAVQTDLVVNHVCATRKGRAGSDVKISLDSTDGDVAYQVNSPVHLTHGDYSSSTIPKRSMAKVTLDSVTFDDIPETFAASASLKFKELDKLQSKLDSVEASLDASTKEIQDLREELEESTVDRDRQMGRADGYEEIAASAIPVLKELGYKWDSDERTFVYQDGNGSKNRAVLDDDEEEDDDEEDDDEEDDDEVTTTSRRRNTKQTVNADSVADILRAWKQADSLVPGCSEDARFDSDLDVTGIHKLVISELEPDFDLTDRSPSFIEGLFDSLRAKTEGQNQNAPLRQDSAQTYHTDNLQSMIGAARSHGTKVSPLTEAHSKRSKELSESWMQNLALSKE